MRVLVFGGLALEEVIKADPRWRPTTEGVAAAAVSWGAADGAIGGSVAKAFARSGARFLLAGRTRRGPVEVATVGSVGAANPAGVPRLGGGS
jgi:hypothetical protein